MTRPPDAAATDLVRPVLAAARRRPDAPAVTAPDGTADYATLVARAEQLAAALRQRGAGPGGRVALVLSPGREAVAAALAAMRLGAAYVPLDPQQPVARLREILANCAPHAVLADPGTAGALPGSLDPAEEIGPWRTPGPGEPTVRAVPDDLPVTGADVAYVVHTSGSTGVPKAVQVEHGGVANMLRDIERRFPLPPAFTGSWWASPSFDAAVWETWAPLTRGGHLIVVPPHARLEVAPLAGHLHRHGVQSAYVPPALLPEFCALLVADERLCPRLARLFVGVEPIALGLLQGLRRARPGLAVLNAYGPAESSVCCTLYSVPDRGGDPHDRTPIGTPVAGNRILLLDEHGRLSDDDTGELVVVGVGVARGYLRGPAGGFIAAPDGSGERAYRTGDRVTRRPDGELVFLGRVDRQFKINGYRLEPGEVEAAVRRSARVQDVVVAKRELPGAGPALVGYVVPDADVPWDEPAVRAALRRVLPAYAVPQLLLTLDAMPLTRHGKTDHAALAALPLPAGEDAQPGADAGARTATEAAVGRAWRREVPGSAPAGTGFVEGGGTSLGAVRVAAALRRTTGRAVRAADVLHARDVGHLAVLVDAAPPDRPTDPPGSRSAPLGPTEQGMWFQDKLHAGKGIYVEALCFELPAGVDETRLATALAAVHAAHPALSAAVRETPSGPRLELDGPGPESDGPGPEPDGPRPERGGSRPVLREHDLGDPGGPVEEAAALGALARASVDLGGPLFRAVLCRATGGRRLLLLVWHHLVTDGWSVRLLVDDLARCYDTALPPTPARTTVCDLMTRRATELDRPGLPDRLRHAAQHLTGSTLPTGSGAADGKRTGTVPVSIDRAATDRLATVATTAGVTLATVLLAAYEQALCDVLGGPDFPLGVAVTDRSWLPAAERTAGCCIDTVVLRGARRDLTAATALRTLGTTLQELTAPEHRVPLPLLVAELRRTTKLRALDFPPCYFSLDEEAELRLDGVRCPPVPVTRTGGRLDATLSLVVGAGGLHGRIEHRWRLLTDAGARQLHERLLHHLAVLTAQTGPGDRPATTVATR
jgi:amino acid adenylation domain-containing protein